MKDLHKYIHLKKITSIFLAGMVACIFLAHSFKIPSSLSSKLQPKVNIEEYIQYIEASSGSFNITLSQPVPLPTCLHNVASNGFTRHPELSISGNYPSVYTCNSIIILSYYKNRNILSRVCKLQI